MNIDIGSKIKTLRLSKSMTQEQLAKALHVSAQAVSKWENGSSLPDIQLLPALSVTLGTSIDSLFSLTDESRFARIDNMLWDKRFLTQQEFDEEEHFLQEKCREEETRPRATLLLAELYCKRAREYNDLASPLARQALALNLDCKEAHNAIFDAEHGAYLDWNATNHYRTIAFYRDFLTAHPENHSAHLWLLDLLIADRRCAEAREVLDKMHRLNPTYNDDFYLGCILLQEGHTDDALAHWEAMCLKYPDTWEVYVMRASELAKLAHYGEAIADCALDAEPAFSGLLRGDELLQRGELRPQVEVVDKGVLFVSDVDECRVQSRHDLAHLPEVDVPHGEARLALLLVQFDEHLVLAHGD